MKKRILTLLFLFAYLPLAADQNTTPTVCCVSNDQEYIQNYLDIYTVPVTVMHTFQVYFLLLPKYLVEDGFLSQTTFLHITTNNLRSNGYQVICSLLTKQEQEVIEACVHANQPVPQEIKTKVNTALKTDVDFLARLKTARSQDIQEHQHFITLLQTPLKEGRIQVKEHQPFVAAVEGP